MTEMFRCGDDETLMAFMYDECTPDTREAVSAHLAWCVRCAEELASLGATRTALSAWQAPGGPLGFRVDDALTASGAAAPVSGTSTKHWWHEPLPAWAQVAAATVIFASGLTLGATRGGLPGMAASAGGPATPASPSGVGPVAAKAAVVSPGDLAAVEQRLRAEMAQIRVRASAASSAASSAGSSPATSSPVAVATAVRDRDARGDEAVLRQVRTMIAESERRQQSEFAVRATKMAQQVDTQRRVDLVQIQRRMGELQEMTGAAVRDQGQMVNYLYNASLRR